MFTLADGTRRYSMNELGVEANRQALIAQIDQAPAGGIIFVKSYEAKNNYGEVADYWYLKGVNYGRMKDRSIERLAAFANDPNFQVHAIWDEWQKPNGERTTARAKDKMLKHFDVTYPISDSRTVAAINKVHLSLTAPQAREAIYEKEGNGIYSEEDGTLHVRDCQALTKFIQHDGDWPITTSSPEVALADAIRKLLPISKYRQVRLDGRFDYISVAGQMVMQSEGGEEVFIGFKEHGGLLMPRIPAVAGVEVEGMVDERLREMVELLGM